MRRAGSGLTAPRHRSRSIVQNRSLKPAARTGAMRRLLPLSALTLIDGDGPMTESPNFGMDSRVHSLPGGHRRYRVVHYGQNCVCRKYDVDAASIEIINRATKDLALTLAYSKDEGQIILRFDDKGKTNYVLASLNVLA